MDEPRLQNLLSKQETLSNDSMANYFSYMTTKEKLANAATLGVLSPSEINAINNVSELEKLELRVLARLSTLSDSSPELLYYFQITGCTDRTSCAKKIAQKSYKKSVLENAITSLLSPAEVKKEVQQSLLSSRTTVSNAFGLK